MSAIVSVDAFIEEISGNRRGDVSEKARITASYETANMAGSFTFDVPISQAGQFYVGQRLKLEVRPA